MKIEWKPVIQSRKYRQKGVAFIEADFSLTWKASLTNNEQGCLIKCGAYLWIKQRLDVHKHKPRFLTEREPGFPIQKSLNSIWMNLINLRYFLILNKGQKSTHVNITALNDILHFNGASERVPEAKIQILKLKA